MTRADLFNFPEGLDIVPLSVQRRIAGQIRLDEGSEGEQSLKSNTQGNDEAETDQQRAWIERYGIAGRIW